MHEALKLTTYLNLIEPKFFRQALAAKETHKQYLAKKERLNNDQTSDAYPGVVPAIGLVNEPTGELLCTASQKARRCSRLPNCTA